MRQIIENLTQEENENSRRNFAEIFTPFDLIEEHLSHLPTSIWTNASLTWFDPAAGMGNYHVIILEKLMDGLKTWDPNPSTRKKHIIENMLFFCEIQMKNISVIKTVFFGYNLNLFEGDFMTYFPENNFDVIVGNPPFEKMITVNGKQKRSTKNDRLWIHFTKRSLDLLKKDGYLCFITPPAWMSPSKQSLLKIFLELQFLVINVLECSKHFNGIGSKFSYYIIKNSKKRKKEPTTFIFDFPETTKLNSCSGESKIILSNIDFIPLIPSLLIFSILDKTAFNKTIEKINVQYDSNLHKYTKKRFLSKTKDENFCYKVIHSPPQIMWSIKPHKTQNDLKVFIPTSTYYEKILIDRCGNTQGMGYVIVNNEKEAAHIKSLLLSKLYRFIANITRWSNFNIAQVMQSFPLIPYKENLTDEFIYDFLHLTKEEIKFINSIVKNEII